MNRGMQKVFFRKHSLCRDGKRCTTTVSEETKKAQKLRDATGTPGTTNASVMRW